MTEPVKLTTQQRVDPNSIASLQPGERTWIFDHPFVASPSGYVYVWTGTGKRSWFDSLFTGCARIRRTPDGIVVEKWRGPHIVERTYPYAASDNSYLPVVGIPD